MVAIAESVRKRMIRLLQPSRLRRVGDAVVAGRFEALRGRYAEVVAALHGGGPPRTDGGSGYAWSAWEQEIFRAFEPGVPADFLRQPRIRDTMVVGRSAGFSERVAGVVAAFGPERARALLREDAVGTPPIVEGTYLTSPNRAHHAYHLANYRLRTSRDPWDCGTVVEWGGGYGNMARLVRRMAPGGTYVIVDLAPLLALQWVYLGSLEGEDACHLVTAAAPEPVAGKVNFVESSLAQRGAVELAADLFLSTWAATESPPAAQAFLAERRFFGARHVLLAYLKDASNHLLEAADAAGCERLPVAALLHEGHAGHEYAVK